MSTIEQTLLRLQQSAFRAKFHLSEKDRQYIMGKGMETIQHHAADFIRMRLAAANRGSSASEMRSEAYVHHPFNLVEPISVKQRYHNINPVQ